LNFFAELIILLLLGIIAGIVSGMFGLGGGVVYVPFLFLLLPLINPGISELYITVISTSLFAGILTSSGAVFQHIRRKNLAIKEGLLLGAGSLISAFIIPQVIVRIDTTPLKYFLGILLSLVALNMFLNKTPNLKYDLRGKPAFLLLSGLVTGVIAAAAGIGGGIIFVPVLMYLYHFNFRVAAGTSSIPVFLTMTFSWISYALGTYYNPGISVSLVVQTGIILGAGGLIGSKIGVILLLKYNIPVIKRIFSLLLIFVILKIFF